MEPEPGEFYRCQITEAHDYDLVARIVVVEKPMARKRVKLRCPICKKPVKSKDADSLSAASAAALIDLGKWASGSVCDLVAPSGRR